MSRDLRNERPPTATVLDLATAAGAAAVALVAYGVLAPDAWSTGDAVVYAHQMRAADLSERTIHWLYVALGAAVLDWLPLSLERALNTLSAAIAATGLGVLFLWCRQNAVSREASVATVLIVSVHPLWMQQAVFAEVYGLLTTLVLMAALAFGHRPFASGAVAGAAVLTSPAAVLALPAVVGTSPARWRHFAMGLGIVAAPVIAFHRADWMFGRRGLWVAPADQVGLLDGLTKEALELWSLWGLAGAFALIAARQLWMHPKGRNFLGGLGLAWLAGWLVGERFADVPVQLPVWMLATPLVGVGLDAVVARSKSTIVAAALIAVVGAGWSWRTVGSARTEAVAYRDACLMLTPADVLLVTRAWTPGVLCSHYLHDTPYPPTWIREAWIHDPTRDAADAPARWADTITRGELLWLHDPSPELRTRLTEHGYEIGAAPSPFLRATAEEGRPLAKPASDER